MAAAFLLATALVAALAVPLILKREPATAPAASGLADRLAAIESSRAAGLIRPAEAAEAEIEIKRAMLAAADCAPEAPRVSRPGRFAALAFTGLTPLAAAWIYLEIGSPELFGNLPLPVPQSIVEMAPEQQGAAIRKMVEGLAARLAANPEDAEGWRMLARSYDVLGDKANSTEAYRQLLARVDGSVEDWRAFAGGLMAIGPGEGREAELSKAMTRLNTFNPDDPLALYYLGAEASDDGDHETAVRHWRRLLEVIPDDAPVRAAIEKMIAEAETGAKAP
ncbi:MAG: c-type cytochrome biogenesis protein CcmI [Parvularculaceae bacterium]